MNCQACRHDNPSDSAFCGACGARLAYGCTRCGRSNPLSNAFCGKCGQRLVADEEPLDACGAGDGERRQLTVLFCDLVGSTDLAARLDPEDYREALQTYHARADEVIAHYQGYVAQHLGDGLLVYFGWPQTYDDAAERAVHAGLELIKATATVHAGGAPLVARVGLHTGPVVVSNVGSGRHRETLAVGDTPNVAARVQGAAEPGELLVTATTQHLVAGLFIVEERGAQALKGVPKPVDLYAVKQSSGVRSRLAASAARGFTPFVNRVEERALLRSRFERVCDGEGQVVLLIGEAGIGKSRLAQVLREELADTPHTWLETAASPHFTNTPFHAVAELLRQRRPWDEDDPLARAAELAEGLRRAGLDPLEALPLVAPLLGIPVPAEYPPVAAAPEIARKRLLATLTQWIFATARLQPLVILIEDLHWVDPSTLELLQILVEQVVTAPVLLLGTARPEFQVPWPSRANSSQLMLSRLQQRHVREMVHGVAAQTKLLAHVVEEVAARTDGVPLFVEELTKAVAEAGAVAVAHRIPMTLTDSLVARLDRLGPQAKEVAHVAAVCGREFSFELVHAVHPIAEQDLEAALRTLVDAELLHARGIPPEATYSFKHALVQDAAYETLLKSRRRQLHGAVAAALVERFRATSEEHPELVAHHHEAAGSLRPAVEAWQRTGELALERGANREAERHLEHALGLLPGLPEESGRDWIEFQLQLSLGKARISSQGFGALAADEALARAMQLGEQLAEPLQLGLILFGRFALDLARNGPAVASGLAERLLEVAERSTMKSLQGAARFATGLIDFHRGNLEAARDRFADGLALLDQGEPLPFPFDAGIALRAYLADATWRLGDTHEARVASQDVIARAEASTRAADRAWAFQHAALLHAWLRDPERVAEYAKRTLDACAEEPSPTAAAMARVLEGWSLAERGTPDAGQALVRVGLSELAGTGQRLGLELVHCFLADTYVALGDLDGALRALADGENACPDQLCDRPDTLLRRAEILVRRDAGEETIEGAFAAALDCARGQHAKLHELRAATGYARWLIGRGRRGAARDLLVPLYATLEGADPRDLAEARELLDVLDRHATRAAPLVGSYGATT